MIKIIIEDIEMDIDKARTVYEELKKLFNNEPKVPYTFPVPTYPPFFPDLIGFIP